MAPARLGSGVWSTGAILAGSSGSDRVKPPGAAISSWRVSRSFLEVLVGTWWIGALYCGGSNPEGAAGAGHPHFVELALLAFVSSFLFYLFFGLVVLLAPTIDM